MATQTAASQRSLTERLVRRLYEEVHGDRTGLTARHVEQVIRLASKSQSGRKVEVPDGILAERTSAKSGSMRLPGSAALARSNAKLRVKNMRISMW